MTKSNRSATFEMYLQERGRFRREEILPRVFKDVLKLYNFSRIKVSLLKMKSKWIAVRFSPRRMAFLLKFARNYMPAYSNTKKENLSSADGSRFFYA